MEAPSRQSISRRGLMQVGFDELRSKTLSVATPYGVPTGLLLVNLHFGKDLGRYVAQRFQTGSASAIGDGSWRPSAQKPLGAFQRTPISESIACQAAHKGLTFRLCVVVHRYLR